MDKTTHSTEPVGTELIDVRKAREQQALIEQLRKMPIISVACEKVGISRQTYYRWRRESEDFANDADEALADGTNLVNDMAESQLLTGIRDGNLGAVQYWLKHRHSAYINRMEVTAKIKHTDDKLTPEQEAAVAQALKLAALTETPMAPVAPAMSPTSSISPPPPSHEQSSSYITG